MYVVFLGQNRMYIHTHKNKVKLFLKIEEKYCYTWTCHVEKCWGFFKFILDSISLNNVMQDMR
jgi:hypothetical protein